MKPDPTQSAGHSGNGGRFTDDHAPPDHPSQAFQDAMKLVSEAKEYGSYFVAAKVDGYKATARNIGIYAALGLVGAAIGVTGLVVSVVMLLTGLAGGLGKLAEHWFGPAWGWLGPTILGLLIIGIAVGVIFFGMRWLTGSSRSTTVAKYEDRKRKQRSEFGHDVSQRAAR